MKRIQNFSFSNNHIYAAYQSDVLMTNWRFSYNDSRESKTFTFLTHKIMATNKTTSFFSNVYNGRYFDPLFSSPKPF